MATSRSKPPRTHCLRGHELAVSGTYDVHSSTSAGNTYTAKCCKQCKKDSAKRRNDMKRDQRKGLERPPPESAAKAGSVDLILQLIDAKDRAGTVWERQAIQERMDAIKIGSHQ